MFTVIRKYRTDPKSAKEIIQRVQDEFVPMISKAPGFVSYDLLNHGDGSVTTVSIFQSKAGADESTRLAASWVRERLAQLLPNPPEVTTGETPIHVTAGQGVQQTSSTRMTSG